MIIHVKVRGMGAFLFLLYVYIVPAFMELGKLHGTGRLHLWRYYTLLELGKVVHQIFMSQRYKKGKNTGKKSEPRQRRSGAPF
jgi:hypothetical protein